MWIPRNRCAYGMGEDPERRNQPGALTGSVPLRVLIRTNDWWTLLGKFVVNV